MAALRVLGGLMVPAMLGLAACSPAPAPLAVQDAQALCSQLAIGQRNQPHMRMGVGLGSGFGHHRTGFGGVGISTNIPVTANRNYEAAYRDCVVKRSGQAPQQTLYQQLGAKG